MSETAFFSARSLDHALDLLAEPGPATTLLAGGTDVLVWMRGTGFVPPRVVDIWGVRAECAHIREEGDEIAVGALASYSEIISAPLVARHIPLLLDACREIGAVQIQNRGTLGGNLGGSSPAGDTLPVLLALEAVVVLQSKAGRRSVPYTEFCTGYRQTVRRPDELCVEVRFPKPAAGSVQRWYKAGTRLAQAISKVMLAGLGHLDRSGRVETLRIGVGSVAPVPVRLRHLERAALGRRIDDALLAEAHRVTQVDIKPIDDVRSTAEYRRRVTGNLAARFLRELEEARRAEG